MMEGMIAVRFAEGEVIFHEGDAPGGVYLINKGRVEISKEIGDQTESLAVLGWNHIFGEMALIDNQPRSATATALEDTWCYMLDEVAFEEKINTLDPFMKSICKVLVNVTRSMTAKYPKEAEEVRREMEPATLDPKDSVPSLIGEDGKPKPFTDLPMINPEG